MLMWSSFLSLFNTAKLYIYAAVAAAAVTFCLMYGHIRYEKGYNAAVQKQTDAIIAYQKIVVDKERQHADELAKISSDHAAQITAIQATKPVAQEKIRVVTKTIERPAVCNLADSELQLIHEAVHSANQPGAH